jgi:hypothetical protein
MPEDEEVWLHDQDQDGSGNFVGPFVVVDSAGDDGGDKIRIDLSHSISDMFTQFYDGDGTTFYINPQWLFCADGEENVGAPSWECVATTSTAVTANTDTPTTAATTATTATTTTTTATTATSTTTASQQWYRVGETSDSPGPDWTLELSPE